MLKFSKIISQIISVSLPIYMFSIAACILCLVVIQIWYHQLTRNVLPWLPIILIILYNDFELNPGPHFQNSSFSFMNWNLNSLVTENKFARVHLIDFHNAILNYDLIWICEISLDYSVDIPDPLLREYTFIPANHPGKESHGRVGPFVK